MAAFQFFGASGAGAQDLAPQCFWVQGSAGQNTTVLTEGTVLRDRDGNISQPSTQFGGGPTTAEKDRGWRPVRTIDGSVSVGELCSDYTGSGSLPTVPNRVLNWLPGATAQRDGIRGAARVTWGQALRNGTPATQYEVSVWRGNQPPYRVSTKVLGASARSHQVDVGIIGNVTIRAWWPDGYSTRDRFFLPEQFSRAIDVTPGPMTITDIALQADLTTRSNQQVRISWNRAVDGNGVAADEYQLLNTDLTDSEIPWIRKTIPGSQTSDWIAWEDSSLALRAVWLSGGPADGPRTSISRLLIDGRYSRPEFASGWNHDVKSLNRTATTAEVRFLSENCVYGDYSIAEAGGRSEQVPVVKFVAPRNGICYNSHGITVGRDTAALDPTKEYKVTLQLTDFNTGAITFVEGPLIRTAEYYCFGKAATIIGSNNSDTIVGTGGDDVIVGRGGSDTIYGSRGEDLICGGSGSDTIYGGPGNDTLRGMDGADTLWGADGNDVIFGGNGNDKVYGGAGNDRIGGGNGWDLLLGGNGADTIFGGNGNDRIGGGNGNDRLFGGAGNDFILGGNGWDSLWGGAGRDDLAGDAGRDRMFGGDGRDTLRRDNLDTAVVA